MINYVTGNILNSQDDAVVNPVNCVGVMGAGLAKQFKDKFPRMFAEYKVLCEDGEIKIGTIHIFRASKYIILNFPTKDNWKDHSKIEYIYQGLLTLKNITIENDIKSISIPPLGCGLGGLNKQDVFEMIEEILDLPRVTVNIYDNQEKK